MHLQSSNSDLLSSPKVETNMASVYLSLAGPTLLNSLPDITAISGVLIYEMSLVVLLTLEVTVTKRLFLVRTIYHLKHTRTIPL